MVIISSYSTAIAMCVVTMLCWGSWANTQKMASKEWKFQLFYWDYAIGLFLFSLVLAFSMGSMGADGRPFMTDLMQLSSAAVISAVIGGIVFNISNILLVAAIDLAGMSVAFPVGVGLALVIGVVQNYIKNPAGNPVLIFSGVAAIVLAMVMAALAYKKLNGESGSSTKGLILSIAAGVLMGSFYGFVIDAIAPGFFASTEGSMVLEAGKATPYTAMVLFSVGLLASNFLWNTIVMYKPFSGDAVTYGDYFKLGTPRLHIIGCLGGAIWCIGMSFNLVASGAVSPAISYGLGQGATLVAAIWGVFIWKEFKGAPKGVTPILAMMFLLYVTGLTLLILSK